VSDLTSIAELIIERLAAADELDQLGALASRLQAEADRRSQPTRVISATELSDDQRRTIQEGLELDEIEFVIDESILGGLILEHEGRRTDLSWRKRLES
jgi:F0F1-type ATP synthase delta subunit